MNLLLPPHVIESLLALPEDGAGYQIVDLLTSDGDIIPRVTVLNAELALLPDVRGLLDPNSITGVRRHRH